MVFLILKYQKTETALSQTPQRPRPRSGPYSVQSSPVSGFLPVFETRPWNTRCNWPKFQEQIYTLVDELDWYNTNCCLLHLKFGYFVETVVIPRYCYNTFKLKQSNFNGCVQNWRQCLFFTQVHSKSDRLLTHDLDDDYVDFANQVFFEPIAFLFSSHTTTLLCLPVMVLYFLSNLHQFPLTIWG